jgi:predicted Fe-Mo cluster-binding NifX family protein
MIENELVAITVWQGRISPVFDVAEEILLCKVLPDGSMSRKTISAGEGSVYQKLELLLKHKVNVLVCGAISKFAEDLVSAHIRIHSFRSGDLEDIVAAICADSISDERFSMPGCRCRRRQRNGTSRGNSIEGCADSNRCSGKQNRKRKRANSNTA